MSRSSENKVLAQNVRYIGGSALVLIGVPAAVFWYIERPATRNLARCEQNQPGVTVADLKERLTGADFYRSGSDETWVAFTTPYFASRSIEARYDSATGTVLELYCADEDRPIWDIETNTRPSMRTLRKR